MIYLHCWHSGEYIWDAHRGYYRILTCCKCPKTKETTDSIT